MQIFENVTGKDFEKIIDFLVTELYAQDDGHTKKADLKEGDLASVVTFLEDRYREDLGGQQIEDIYVDADRRVLYLETPFDPEDTDDFVLCVDHTGRLTKEELDPDHPLFDAYAAEEEL